jgi:putative DNA primase/helicase
MSMTAADNRRSRPRAACAICGARPTINPSFCRMCRRADAGNLQRACNLDIRQVARALGGTVIGRDSVNAPGPGHSPGDRSLSVKLVPDIPDGFLVHSFAGDDPRLCRDYVREKLGLPCSNAQGEATRNARSHQSAWGSTHAERTTGALSLWNEAEPLGPLARKYFASRGIWDLPPGVHGVLRFQPGCPFGPGERHPCILSLVRNILTNAPQAVHRTALTPDGQKLDRKALGPTKGGAIKFWPDEEVTAGLVIGEGLETTLAAATRLEHRGTLLRPAWATIDAGHLGAFPVLRGIAGLTILVDHDESGTGQQEARKCAQRWLAAGREVTLLTPRDLGTDFNDVVEVVS